MTKWHYKKDNPTENVKPEPAENGSENNKYSNPYANMPGKQALKTLASKNNYDDEEKDKGGRPKSVKAGKVISMHINKISMKLTKIRKKTLQDEIEELTNDALFELSILKEYLKEMKIL